VPQRQAVPAIQPGIDLAGQPVEPAGPAPVNEFVQELLGFGKIVDTREAIVPLLVTQAGP
jgi:hypothetical protein